MTKISINYWLEECLKALMEELKINNIRDILDLITNHKNDNTK